MFSRLASTIPAPATDRTCSGAVGGVTIGCDGGIGLLISRTWSTAKTSPATASSGRTYLVNMLRSFLAV